MHLKTSNTTYRRATKARPIKVHFPVPKRAISTLRALAIGRDPRLVNLGVLAVQISDDESIVLGIELEKTKRKPLSVTNSNENSARVVSKSPIGVSFESLTRKLETSPGSGFNHQFTTTPQQRDSFSSRLIKPSQNKSVKRKAKSNSNTEGVRGKTIKKHDKQMPGLAKGTSTWEMVYSHKGIHGDSWGINRSIPPQVEPIAASQASGVANVPVSQPTLSIEISNATKETSRKRDTPSVSSPQRGSTSGIYSEDDSSVSSSPCSHSPMNEEELLNLFVDQNFSATSILRQLAEGRHKGDDKNSAAESSEVTEPNESKVSNEQTILDTTKRTLVYGDNSGNGKYSLATGEGTTVRASIDCLKESVSTTNTCASNTSTNSLSWSPSSLKRSNKEDISSSISWLNLFENSTKRQCRTLTDLESKKAVTDMPTKTVRRDKQRLPHKKSQDTPTTYSSTLPIVPNETALRNFQEYGYYYSSEDLKALGASKSIKVSSKSKAESAQQNRNSLNTSNISQTNKSTSIISQAKPRNTSSLFGTESVPVKDHTTETVLEQPSKDDSTKSEEDCSMMSSAESVLPNSSSQVTPSAALLASLSTSVKNTSTSTTNTTDEACSASPTPVTLATSNIRKTCTSLAPTMSDSDTSTKTCVVSSTSTIATDSTTAIASTSSTLTTSLSTSTLVTTTLTTSTTLVTTTSSTSTPLVTDPTTETCPTTSASPSISTSAENGSSTSMVNLKRSGQYYALSYVYPMGTVWYPYVAITPYAAVGFNQEQHGNDQPTTEGLATSSQYIDLASSMRYWQQLSLLYKNKLLASTPVFVNTDNNSTSGTATSEQSSTDNVTNPVSPSNQTTCSTPFGSTDCKPTRRASVIVPNNEYGKDERAPTSTPESMESTESTGSEHSKSEALPVVIDNCNRLIEEHCNRMSEVFAEVSQHEHVARIESSTATPSLSFIPDSSIAYVNIGNTPGTKKSGSSGKDTKGKSKKKRQNKNV